MAVSYSRLSQEYRQKLITPEKAAALVKSGDCLEFGIGNSKPVAFLEALSKRRQELREVSLRNGLTLPPAPSLFDELEEQDEHFTWNAWHFSALDRELGKKGKAWFVPMLYHELPRLIREFVHIDMAVLQVAPIDNYGYFNFGTTISHLRAICDKAKTVIVEVNENMPRVKGGCQEGIHISEVDWIVEGDSPPLVEFPRGEVSLKEKEIARLILEEIEDGCCIQLGIGELADYIGQQIAKAGFKNLGVHTELLGDAFLDMYEAGCITGSQKRIDRGKMVFTFALGSKKLYEFINENMSVAGYPVDYTNTPAIIARNPKVISINNFLEIDLTGQVCSESVGPVQISGTGGQVDFVKGAFDSKGGKSFLCMPSTYIDKEGTVHSRIKATLTPGACVTVPRTVTHYVVTEYGKACLKGKSVWERAEALVGLAHPDFREELIRQAEDMKIWRRSNRLRI